MMTFVTQFPIVNFLVMDGQPSWLLEASFKPSNDLVLEGTFYISQRTKKERSSKSALSMGVNSDSLRAPNCFNFQQGLRV